ncbi:MAG TPA: insulinase family protein, partial [Myxococcota bacterium]|nr:insulinase family protein [Myxococcota bacterium]
DPSFAMVRFLVATRDGATQDPPDAGGAMRAMMELLLRGTRRASRPQFNGALEALGSAVETTAGHELAYVSGVALARHLEPTVALVGEALCEPALAEQELRPLTEETIESLRAERDDDDAVADIFLRRALYPAHPLGRSPAGSVPELEALTVEHVRAAHRRLAAPELIIGMAGAVTVPQAEALFAPVMSRLDRAAPPVAPVPPAPRRQGLHIVVVDKPDRTQVQLRVARLSLDGRHPDLDAFWLGITAFGGTFTSPLTRAVRDERGWSYVAHADFRRRSLYPSPVVLRSAPALEDAVNCLELELELLRDLADGKLSPAAVELSRDYLLNRTPFETATSYDLLAPAVTGELLGLPRERLWNTAERLAAIDLDAVPGIVARHMPYDGLLALLVAPAAAVVPALEGRFPDAHMTVVDFREGLGLNDSP